jgi:TRAP-type C4-dicarboxylate transport system permease small subunit
MSSIIDAYLELLDLLDRIVKYICIAIGGLMALVVILQVFSRYLPTPTPKWTEELSRYLMIFMAYIGASNGIKLGSNIFVDFFINRMPGKVRKTILLIINILILAFLCYLFYLSVMVFPKVGLKQYSATLDIPMFYPQSAIIIGTLLMALQLTGVIIKSLRKEPSE